VARIVRSDYLRFLLLNTPLIVIFSAAWISDRVPWLSGVAIIAAIFTAALAATLLYLSAKADSRARMPPRIVPVAGLHGTAAHDVVTLRAMAHLKEQLDSLRSASTIYERLSHDLCLQMQSPDIFLNADVYGFLHRIDQQEGKNMAVVCKQFKTPSLPAALLNWKLDVLDPDSFNLKAGDFEIEHFYGHTNIRVLNADSVTAEGTRRSVAPSEVPWVMRPLAVN
jgi:hypothetical protein